MNREEMVMKKMLFLFFTLFVFAITPAMSQNGRKGFDKEAFRAKHNAYITAQVGLTPEEAAKFIPLCNEMQDKMFHLGRTQRVLQHGIYKKLRDKDNPTNAEYLKVINASLDVHLQQAKLEKEYNAKFLKILSPEKLFKYREAEARFFRDEMPPRQGNKDNND